MEDQTTTDWLLKQGFVLIEGIDHEPYYKLDIICIQADFDGWFLSDGMDSIFLGNKPRLKRNVIALMEGIGLTVNVYG